MEIGCQEQWERCGFVLSLLVCPGPWVSWGYLLRLGSGTKQQAVGRGDQNFCEIHKRLGVGEESCHGCSVAQLGMRLGDLIWGNRNREKRRSVGKVPDFLASGTSSIIFICMCVCVPCVHGGWCLWSLENSTGFPGVAVTGSFELPELAAGNPTHGLWKTIKHS